MVGPLLNQQDQWQMRERGFSPLLQFAFTFPTGKCGVELIPRIAEAAAAAVPGAQLISQPSGR